MIAASSYPGDLVLDCFAGSGTTGAAALALGRRFMLVDDNAQALEVMARRFADVPAIEWIGFDPALTPQPLSPMEKGESEGAESFR